MNIVNLIVNKQRLMLDDSNGFIAEGQYNYAKLHVDFVDSDWLQCDIIIASFENNGDTIYREIMGANNLINVPPQIVSGEVSVSLQGFNNIDSDSTLIISTNAIAIPIERNVEQVEQGGEHIEWDKIIKALYNVVANNQGLKFQRVDGTYVTITPQELKQAIDLSEKLDKKTTLGIRVYSHNGQEQGEIAAAILEMANSIMLRDNNGRSKVAEPNEYNDIANKDYVDRLINALQLSVTTIENKINACYTGTGIFVDVDE